MAEATGIASPPLDIDGIVVDLHTNRAAAATAAQALLNENSNASSEAGINLKFPTLFSSSSESEGEQFDLQRNPLHGRLGNDDAAATTTSGRPASPPPNCAICLGRCKNKCFTNSCVHQFCFKCLAEWSKVKAECPLCKQQFRSIIYNVKSEGVFEEYHVQTPTVQLPHNPVEVTYQGQLRGFSVNAASSYYNFSMRSIQRGNAIASRNVPITISNYDPNYVGHDFGAGDAIPSASVAVGPMPMRAHFLRRHMPGDYGNDMPVGQLWRRYIYERKLYALPVSDVTGRFRECSARYYRANPGQIIRLIPFANRDLVCLLRNTSHNVTRVLEVLNESLEISNILSRSFRRRLQPFLGEQTAHFIHELSNFARSPYDIIGYDDYVQYAPQHVGEEQVIEFSSSGGEETNNNTINNNSNNNNNNNNNNNVVDDSATSSSNDVNNRAVTSRRHARRLAQAAANNLSTAPPPTSYSPVSLLSFTITTTTEGSEAPGVSVAVSAGGRGGHAQVAAINLSTHNRSHNEVVIDLDDTIEVNGSGNANANGSNGSGSNNADSSNSTAQVAAANTAPLASAVNANSSSTAASNNGTADTTTSTTVAQAGSPQIFDSIALTTSSSDECEFVLERKPPHLRTPEMVVLNSESDSDVVFIDESKPILAEATYSTSDENDDKKTTTLTSLIAEQEQQRAAEASTSTGLRSCSLRNILAAKRLRSNATDSSGSNKKRRTRMQPSRKTQGYGNDDDDDDTTTENDSDNESDFGSSLRQKRTRRTASSSGSRKRQVSSTTRKRGNVGARKSRKRPRPNILKAAQPKQQANEHSTNNQSEAQAHNENDETSQSQTMQRRLSQQRRMRNDEHCSSTENESTTEEDEKVNLKALQLRLKSSLSDVEANMAEQALSEAETETYRNNYLPPDFSPQLSIDSTASKAQNETAVAGDANLKDNNQNLTTNNFCCDNLHDDDDERPSTSAAAAAAAAAAANKSNSHNLSTHEDSNSDRDEREDNESKTATPLNSQPNSPAAPSTEEHDKSYHQRHWYSPAYASSNSSFNSFQLPSTSQQCRNGEQNASSTFPARFKYSSSSNSSSNSSASTSSMSQSSASSSSASEEDELN